MPLLDVGKKEKDISGLTSDLHTCIIAALVPIATKIRDQTSCPTVDKLVNKIWQIEERERFSTIK